MENENEIVSISCLRPPTARSEWWGAHGVTPLQNRPKNVLAKSRALKTILIAGAIAGILDISYACIFNYQRRGMTPMAVLQSVASGAVGPENATKGGVKTAALGLFFHFLIATTAAAVYYLASRVIRFMITHAVISGILYGLCVYLFMYGIIFRVAAFHSTRLPWD